MADPVARARKLLGAATTDPPWEAGHGWVYRPKAGGFAENVFDYTPDGGSTWPNCDLIAAAPELLASLSDEVERLRGALDAIRDLALCNGGTPAADAALVDALTIAAAALDSKED